MTLQVPMRSLQVPVRSPGDALSRILPNLLSRNIPRPLGSSRRLQTHSFPEWLFWHRFCKVLPRPFGSSSLLWTQSFPAWLFWKPLQGLSSLGKLLQGPSYTPKTSPKPNRSTIGNSLTQTVI